MKNKIIKIFLNNIILQGSFIILVSSVFANLGNYLFHLFMGRMLGPADYGLLQSLISILYYLGIPMSVLAVVVVKFISENNQDKNKISLFLKKIRHKFSFYGLLGLVLFLISYPLINRLLRINSVFLFLGIGICFYLGIFYSINSSSLRGLMNFFKAGILGIFETGSKLTAALIFVFLGFGIGGAVGAIIFSLAFALFLSTRFLEKDISFKISGDINIQSSFNKIKAYSLSVFLSNLSMTSLYTADIILARYFLSPVEAGKYAALSVLSKIIFFASSPVSAVMFPVICEKNGRGEDYKKLFWLSVLIVFIISFSVCLVYYFFPDLMISLLYGKGYLSASGNLFSFAIFIFIYSLCSLFLNYFLSVSKVKAVVFSIGGALLQLLLIIFFHQSIFQIISVNIAIVSLLLVSFLIYYACDVRQKRLSVGYCPRL